MNTANLQLEGLLAALAAINSRLVDKDILSRDEIAEALADAERHVAAETGAERSEANAKAVLFPIRYLADALVAGPAEDDRSFRAITAHIGRTDDTI